MWIDVKVDFFEKKISLLKKKKIPEQAAFGNLVGEKTFETHT